MATDNTRQGKNLTGTILKWIGIATAVISLILGVNQLNILWKAREQRKATDVKIAGLIADAHAQLNAADYETGWKTLDQAHALNPDSRTVQNEQVAFAMKWLRELIFINTGGKDSDITSRLLPVLYHSANASKGKQAADIVAHIGWANFLQERYGNSYLKIDELFNDAVKKDSLNVYGHAMWGYRLLQQEYEKENTKNALEHFSLALRDGRDSVFVRLLQIWGLEDNKYNPDAQAELLNIVNAMRLNHEILTRHLQDYIVHHAYDYYTQDAYKRISQKLSPADHLQTFLYLTMGRDLKDQPPYQMFILAELTEKAGDIPKSLSIYKAMSADSTLINYVWFDNIRKAIKRISKN